MTRLADVIICDFVSLHILHQVVVWMYAVRESQLCLTYTTQTREVSIDFFFTTNYRDAFTISVISKRNKYRILESSRNGSTGYIRSPFFPELYPKDYWVEYELLGLNENRRVKITFLDFQISPWSFVEVQDTNESRLAVFSGNIFRPPVLTSSGPQITIRFNANGETARGFNLQYSFISKDSPAMIPPMSDCGGYVTNFGGTITMMNMAKGAGNATLYDCVWIIQPPQNFAFKTHVFIKVVQFEEMAARASIEIRQGLTSDDYLLETITGGEKQTTSKEHVVSVDTGFYVRLQGFFSRDTKVAIVYTSFSVLGNCYAMTDHMCHNHRCIPKMLRCDGFDHCGDGSDEPNSCYGGVPGEHHLTPEDQAWWYQHTPNYYFPQKTRLFANPYGSSMMLLFSLFVLILIIIGLVSYMARQGNQDAINNRRHRDRTHRERNNGVNDGVEIFDAAADDPPSYEHPPDYEEVIKFILSGNNLKLIRRPGGLTAWMPDIPKMQNNSSFERNADGSLRNPQIQWLNQGNEAAQQLVPHQSLSVQRPLRTRHASLDMEQAEVVLWNSNANHLSDELSRPDIVRQHSTPLLPSLHTRRSSLPSAPQPELMQAYTSNRDSMGPATIVEIPEGADSPLLGSRIIIPPSQMSHSSSVNPTISNSNNNSLYESGEISSESTTNLLNMSNDQSSPGPSTRNASSKTVNLRKTKSKNGGKRRKTSAVKKSMRRKREEEAAPPSYEMAMQQSSQNSNSPLSDSTGTQTESTQIAQPEIDNDIDLNTNPEASISEQIVTVAESSLLPSQRIKSAREKFQKLSANENAKYGELSTIRESLPSNVSFRSTKIRSPRNGGTISKGTVKARKAMLMRARTPSPSPYVECICNGACSCANFKNGSEMIDDCVSSGAVKSKVDYYLKIKEQLKNEEYDSPEELVKNDIKDTCKSSKIKSKNSPYNKKKAFLRNKSIPHPQLANNHDLDIYFSQDNSSFVQNTIDITDKIIKISKYENEVMNVASTSKAKEIDDISYKFVGNAEKEENPKSSDVKQVSSIRKHVHLYNELAKNKEVQSVDSPSLLNSENGQAVICMHVLKSNTLDSEIKAGIVKDTKEKYIASTIMDTEGNKLSISQDDVQQQNLSIITNEQTQEHLEEEDELSVDLNECLIKDKGIFDHSTKSNTENSQKIDSIDETDFHESMSEEENENSITENLPLIAKHCKSRKLEKKEVKGIDKEGNDYNEGCTSEEFEKNTPTLAILSDAEELKTDIDLSCIESINDSISTIDSIDNHLSEPEKNYNINFIPDQCEIKNDSMKKLPTNKGSNSINTKEESLSSQTQTLIKNEEKTQNILQGVNKTTQPIVSVSPSKESPSSFTKKDLDLECSPIKSFIRDDIEQNSEFYIIKDIKEADTSSMSMSSRSNSPYDITEEIIDPITEYIKETEPQHDENKISISPTSCDNYSTAYLNLTSSSSPRQNLRQIPHQTEEEFLPSDQDCTQITDVNTRSGIIVVKDGSQIRWDYI
ncbi:unnamed protein product [Meganyctiphanes norvegica]|uniref:CUB domain-containing protein n=1 Tax=Meganyctiphanes norvegica TaxID=48144 RepID=A0AAV2R8L8_MEGNR